MPTYMMNASAKKAGRLSNAVPDPVALDVPDRFAVPVVPLTVIVAVDVLPVIEAVSDPVLLPTDCEPVLALLPPEPMLVTTDVCEPETGR